jgi:hypothetical protein
MSPTDPKSTRNTASPIYPWVSLIHPKLSLIYPESYSFGNYSGLALTLALRPLNPSPPKARQ